MKKLILALALAAFGMAAPAKAEQPSSILNVSYDIARELFVDINNSAFTNALDGDGQTRGFAGRISVNPAIVQDNSLHHAILRGLVRHYVSIAPTGICHFSPRGLE